MIKNKERTRTYLFLALSLLSVFFEIGGVLGAIKAAKLYIKNIGHIMGTLCGLISYY